MQNEFRDFPDIFYMKEGYPNLFVSKETHIKTIEMPKMSEWSMCISHITFQIPAGKVPNAFHRLMQRLILGVEWKKDVRPQ